MQNTCGLPAALALIHFNFVGGRGTDGTFPTHSISTFEAQNLFDDGSFITKV
jgi:hypothetical protein